MLLHDLTINNFGTIEHEVVPLSNQGQVLILGDNRDAPKASSNGAGKSMVLDAFAWCWWGQTVRSVLTSGRFDPDTIVHKHKKQDCFSQIRFQENDSEYVVYRCRKNKSDKRYKPNDLVLLKDGVDVSGSSIEETQEMLVSLIGLDFYTFCAMMPGAGVKVAELTDQKIKELLERLLQTETLSVAYKHALSKSKEVSSEVSGISNEIDKLEYKANQLGEQRNSYLEESRKFQEKKDKKLLEIDKRISGIQSRLASIDEELEKYQNNEEKVSETRRKIEAVDESIRAALENKKQAEEEVQKVRYKEVESAGKYEMVYQSITPRLENLCHLEGTCDKCEQEVPEEHLDTLRTDLGQQLQEAMDVRKESKLSLKEELDEAEKVVGQYLDELASLDSSKKLLKSDLDRFQKEHYQIKMNKEKKEDLVKQLKDSEKEKDDVSKDENPFFELASKANDEAVEFEDEVVRKRKELEKFEKQKELLDFWVQAFSPSGIRNFMLDHVTPLLNQAAKKYSDLITSGEMEVTFHTKEKTKGGKTKEKFNVQVRQEHGGESYSTNSTGERSRANLVISLALSDLARMRARKHLPFRFLDEPFENVDDVGTGAIIKLLREQQKDYGAAFVITHQDAIKEFFTKTMTVVKENCLSRIEYGE